MPCDDHDHDLFHASTIVTLGDGKTATFWNSSWFHGTAPRNFAPTLYRKAKRKNITVSTGRGQMDRPHHTAKHTGRGSRVCHSLGSHSWNKPGSYYTRWYTLTPDCRWGIHNQECLSCAIRRHIQQTKNYANMESEDRAQVSLLCLDRSLLHKKSLMANNLNKRN